MLTVSDSALAHIAHLLAERDAPEGVVVRCVVEGESLALVPDSEQDGDVSFSHEDRVVFVVSAQLGEALDGHEFDVESGDEGEHLTLK